LCSDSLKGETPATEPAGVDSPRSGFRLETKELTAFAHKVFDDNQTLCARADHKLSFAFAAGAFLTGGLLPLVKPTLDLLWCSACPLWKQGALGGLLTLSLIFAGWVFLSIYRGVFPADSRHANLTGARELVYGVHISRRPSNAAYLAEVRQLDQEGELVEWVNQAYEVGHIEAQKMGHAKAAFRALMLQGMTEFSAWALIQAMRS
jgi:hypothetical protein